MSPGFLKSRAPAHLCEDVQRAPRSEAGHYKQEIRRPGDTRIDVSDSSLNARAIHIEVHKALGPGLLESAYRECLAIELKHANLEFESERSIRLQYKGTNIKTRLRIDMLVEGVVIVELKSVECLHPSTWHRASHI